MTGVAFGCSALWTAVVLTPVQQCACHSGSDIKGGYVFEGIFERSQVILWKKSLQGLGFSVSTTA